MRSRSPPPTTCTRGGRCWLRWTRASTCSWRSRSPTTADDARAIASPGSRFRPARLMVNFSQRYVWTTVDQTGDRRRRDGRPQAVISVPSSTPSRSPGHDRRVVHANIAHLFMSSHDLDMTYWFLAAAVEVYAQETSGTLRGMGSIAARRAQRADPVRGRDHCRVPLVGGSTRTRTPRRRRPPADHRLRRRGNVQQPHADGRALDAAGGQRLEFTGPHTADDEVGGKITGGFTESVARFITCGRAGAASPRRRRRHASRSPRRRRG